MYGKALFAAKTAPQGMEGAIAALTESLELWQGGSQEGDEVSAEMLDAVRRALNCPVVDPIVGGMELDAYINANPRQRCSLGATIGETSALGSDKMPIGTKIQMFSNRLPGGMTSDPIVGNILLTSRYGAVSSRVGRMENQVLGIFGGIAELPISLELVQAVHDDFIAANNPIEHPLEAALLIDATKRSISAWQNRRGISIQLSESELVDAIADVDKHWSDAEREAFLKRLDRSNSGAPSQSSLHLGNYQTATIPKARSVTML